MYVDPDALLTDSAAVYSDDVARPRPAKTPSFWARTWAEIEPGVRAVAGDTTLGVVLLGALTIAYLVLEGIKALGYPEDRVARLESLHYWAYLVVFVVFLLNLLYKVVSIYLLRRRE